MGLAARLPGGKTRAERDRLRSENAALRRRLARATGPRPDLGYLFVLTYGRSGSTLVQGILNSIPGYVIRGENRQMMRHLYEFDRTGMETRRFQRKNMRRRHDEPGSSDPSKAFYGMDAFPHQRSIAGIRRLAVDTLLRPEPDTRVVGFKEIRWSTDDLSEFVAWLREVFPTARFVVNTRNLDDVSRSKWWGRDPEALDHLVLAEKRLLALLDELGEAGFHVRYDEYVADPRALEPMYAWLGEPFDEASVREVLAVRHSY